VSYEHGYTYDQGGNRLVKSNVLTTQWDQYFYDYDDPATYESANNRLEKVAHYDGIFPAVLTGTTYYYYNTAGNVTRIVHEPVGGGPGCDVGDAKYTVTRFDYAKNCSAVTHVVGEEWCWNGVSSCPEDYEVVFAREFRYDGSRQRYLNRAFDPAALNEDPPDFGEYTDTWSDYDGNAVYGDFTVSGGVSNVRSYEPGMAKVDPWVSSGSGSTDYYHMNHIGSTRFMTDSSGADIEHAAYTAFGERVSGNARRYGYDGSWGYQTHRMDEVADLDPPLDPDTVFPYLHLGARYYDPATGRFLQRDPIGIAGGANVYAYVESGPTLTVDPAGLYSSGEFVDDVAAVASAAKTAVLAWIGKTSPATKVVRPVVITADALRLTPDLVRICVSVGHRNKSMKNSSSVHDFLDRYDAGHNKFVKPGG